MKKLLLAMSCLALTSTASMAADMAVPYTKAPVMAAPVFTWTGCYIGGHVGGGTMTSDIFSSTNDFNGRGGVAGGQVGCNYQDGNWVFGLEGEGYWSGIKISDTSSRIFNGVTDSIINTTLKNDSDFTIAARVGYTIDRTMIYGKGGWAWGSLKATGFNTCCFTSPPATTETFLSSGTLDGFMVGIGIEHMLTRNWTVKLEYDYIGFGNKELAATICPTPSTCVVPFSNSFSATKQIFKVGANYLFDLGGAPLVAKY